MKGKAVGDHRICFVGDSLVQGTADPDGLGWVGRLGVKARQDGWNVTNYNLGIRGDTSRDILARWKGETERRFPADTPNYMVFSFGVNDTLLIDGVQRVSLSESRENFQKILNGSLAQYPTVMIGPPPVSDPEHNRRIEEVSHSFNELAQRLNVQYLAVCETLRQDTIWMKEVNKDDGAHPGAGGYQQLANLVAAWPAWFLRSSIL